MPCTQRPSAQVILEADRDFLFAVKDSQPDLVEAVRASFAAAQCPNMETREKKGGEIHTHKLWIREGECVDYIREATSFPGIELILRVDSEVRLRGTVTRHEPRYFIASLSADEV